MSREHAHTRYGDSELKQTFCVVIDASNPDDHWHVRYKDIRREEVLVGIKNGLLRLRFPKGDTSPVLRIPDASHDLKCVAALTVFGLVPTGVLADKLEEDHPAYSEACRILREYDRIKRMQQ